MKTLILAVAMGSMACGGLAQGRFIFSNRSTICTPLVDAKHLSISANPATLTMEGPRQVQVWFSLESCRLSTSGEPDQVRLEWTPRAVLEARDALMPGDWRDVSAAASPYDVEPAHAQRFYRLRRPRRLRPGKTGSGPREASGVRRFTGAFCRNDPPKAALKRTHSTRSATSPAGDGPREARRTPLSVLHQRRGEIIPRLNTTLPPEPGTSHEIQSDAGRCRPRSRSHTGRDRGRDHRLAP